MTAALGIGCALLVAASVVAAVYWRGQAKVRNEQIGRAKEREGRLRQHAAELDAALVAEQVTHREDVARLEAVIAELHAQVRRAQDDAIDLLRTCSDPAGAADAVGALLDRVLSAPPGGVPSVPDGGTPTARLRATPAPVAPGDRARDG